MASSSLSSSTWITSPVPVPPNALRPVTARLLLLLLDVEPDGKPPPPAEPPVVARLPSLPSLSVLLPRDRDPPLSREPSAAMLPAIFESRPRPSPDAETAAAVAALPPEEEEVDG